MTVTWSNEVGHVRCISIYCYLLGCSMRMMDLLSGFSVEKTAGGNVLMF